MSWRVPFQLLFSICLSPLGCYNKIQTEELINNKHVFLTGLGAGKSKITVPPPVQLSFGCVLTGWKGTSSLGHGSTLKT